MIKTFKTRILPTKEQEEYLNKCFGYRRFVYNHALEYFNKLKEYNKGIDKAMMKYYHKFDYITNIYSKIEDLPGNEWTKGFNVTIKNETAADFQTAMERFFKDITSGKQCDFHFKRKIHGSGSFRLYNKHPGRCIKVLGNNLFSFIMTKELGHMCIKTRENINILRDCDIKNLTISMKNHKYYVSFAYEIDSITHVHEKLVIGVDLGIKNPVVGFDGESVFQPKFPKKEIKKLESKIDRLSYIVSKKKYDKYAPSKNYIKARTKLNKIYGKTHNIRMDYIHKTTTSIVKKYKNIVIDEFSFAETLSKFSTVINRAAYRIGIYTLTRILKYKCEFYDTNYIPAPPNSTITCSKCGHMLSEPLPLHKRTFTCPTCNYKQDRDINASINIFNTFDRTRTSFI